MVAFETEKHKERLSQMGYTIDIGSILHHNHLLSTDYSDD